MAQYRNDSGATVYVRGIGEMLPGATGTPIPNTYLHAEDLVQKGLTKVGESPSPWMILHADSLPATFTGLEDYKQIGIMNDTDNTIFAYPNGHEGVAVGLPVFKSSIYPIKQEREITQLVIDGDGSGDVYLICLRND
jgi:hypothetical protein